jgi:uncharacterized protein DUF3604
MVACSRDGGRARAGRLSSEPALLTAPLSRVNPGVLHGRLRVRLDGSAPAGTAVRVAQGYRDEGHELGGSELRYPLPPLEELSGRAMTIGARLVGARGEIVVADVPVRVLPAEAGWFEAVVPAEWPAGADLEIALGHSERPEFGPLASPLPIDLDLFAELRGPLALRLDGSVPVRIADVAPRWLRVLAPATAAPSEPLRVVVDFMDDWSGPARSSSETPPIAGELELAAAGATRRFAVAADPHPDRPHGVEFELPPLPAGWQRVAATFHAGTTILRGLSAPLLVSADPADRLWFGSLHDHTLLGGHAASTPPRAIAYARDVARLDFVALSEHREAPTFDGAWLADLARRETRDGRFVVFTAWEWTHPTSGHRHVVARLPAVPPPAPPDLATFAKTVASDPDLLVIVHHPLWDGGAMQKDYDYGAPGALPRQLLAEAYSWHGDSLRHDSAFPMHANHEQELPPAHHQIVDALAAGHRLFLIADSDNHLGRPGGLVGIEWPKGRRYAFQGVVAARAGELTREAIFRALERGDCYGTTGARIHLKGRRDGTRVLLSIHAAAPLAWVELSAPAAILTRQEFEAVAADAGAADAPLFLDPARGTWETELALEAGAGHDQEPLIVELAQQDFHHAWLLLPPASWTRR